MGDLSGTTVILMARIITDASGQRYQLDEPVPLSPAPENIRLATESKPWNNYWRMLGTVMLAFLIVQFGFASLIEGALSGISLISVIGAICSLAPIPLLLLLHKPKLVHVRLAVPDVKGKRHHPLPEGGSLRTVTPTRFKRFLTADDSVLDLPPPWQVWLVFSITVATSAFVTLFALSESTEWLYILLFILLAIPLWIMGFSIPVFAWWATSSKWIGLPTRRRDAEAWLIAGMASAFPAMVINTWIFPGILPSSLPSAAAEFLLLVLSAPLGEELWKLVAVLLFLPSIKSPRHGLQIGFTVGLGFALIENMTYILMGAFEGSLSLGFTTLIRGIGSIPGHALWTGVSGFAVGCLVEDYDMDKRIRWLMRRLTSDAVDAVENLGIDVDGDGDHSGYDQPRESLAELLAEVDSSTSSWLLIDSKTGETRDADGVEMPQDILTDLVTSSEAARYRSEDGIQILPPRNILQAYGLAVIGHAIWNGTSYLSFLIPEWIGLGEIGVLICMFGWTAVLIAAVLWLTRRVLSTVRRMPTLV
ncbi:MAG: PrsW family glutamic-type intramembrane protease [Candidatus Thalassarchaeaceae archaeon]|nr:PrsW family glutamic-type intramembrane protease [Candidatus Thalassarchaeaceae archaeon]